MNKINFGTLNSANIVADNSADEARVYNIKGNVNYQSGNAASVDSGSVIKDGVEYATFNHWSDTNQQVTWSNCPKEEKDDVQIAIDAFIATVREEIQGTTVTL